jgi:hypothetical protein
VLITNQCSKNKRSFKKYTLSKTLVKTESCVNVGNIRNLLSTRVKDVGLTFKD